MRLSDPKVAGLRYATDLPLLKADVSIVSADPKNETCNEVRDAVEDALFNKMAYSWRSTLAEILRYRDYGFVPFEIIWNTDDGKVGIDRLAYRPPGTIWWIWGANGRVDRVEQSVFGHWLTIPGEKLMWFVNQREGENWRGRSVLRPMHKPWYQKERLETLLLILIERMGGVPVFKEGASVAASKKLQAKIDLIMQQWRMGESMGLRLPPDVDFELLPSQAKPADIIRAIEYYDTQMSNVLLAQVLDLGKTATGSRALGMTMGDMLEESCEAEANQVEDVFNAKDGLIYQFVTYNFGEDPDIMPRLQFGRLGKVDPLVFGQGLNNLAQAGITFDDPLTVEEIRHLLQLPELDPDAVDSQETYLEHMKAKQEAALNATQNLPSTPPPLPQPGPGQTVAQQTAAAVQGVSPEFKADISKPASPIAAPMLPGQRPPVIARAAELAEGTFRQAPTAKLARLESFCDLDEISATMAGQKDAIKAATATTREAQATELAKRARAAADAGRVASFVASRPPMVDALTKQIAGVLTAHYNAGRKQVADELDRQRKGEAVAQEIIESRQGGGSAQLADVPTPTSAGAGGIDDRIAQEAEVAARAISIATQAAAGKAVLRTASSPLRDDQIVDLLMGASDTAALQQGATVTRLMGDGRIDQAAADSAEIASATYSAVMDRNTCDTCEGQDGDETTDLDEAAGWTPNPDCDGGEQCRCLVVYEIEQPDIAETTGV
jgi:phage gp29-like protein